MGAIQSHRIGLSNWRFTLFLSGAYCQPAPSRCHQAIAFHGERNFDTTDTLHAEFNQKSDKATEENAPESSCVKKAKRAPRGGSYASLFLVCKALILHLYIYKEVSPALLEVVLFNILKVLVGAV